MPAAMRLGFSDPASNTFIPQKSPSITAMSLKRAASGSSSSSEESKAQEEVRAAKRRASDIVLQSSATATARGALQRAAAGPGALLHGYGLNAAQSAASASASAATRAALLENLVLSGAAGATAGSSRASGQFEPEGRRLSPSFGSSSSSGSNRATAAATTMSPAHIQSILAGGFPRPIPTALGAADAQTQAMLAASRFGAGGLPPLANPYSSLLSSFPASSGLSLGNLASHPSMAHHQTARQHRQALEAQIRAAQLMALRRNQVDPNLMLQQLGQQQQQQQQQFTQQQLLQQQQQQLQSHPSLTSRSSPPSSPAPRGTKRKAARATGTASTASSTPSPGPTETLLAVAGALPPAIPPAVEGSTPHYREREGKIISMSTDEDQNWLSEFQCFIRSEILEVFRASAEDVQIRNNSKTLQTQQIGIRCRFCAHLPPSARASRSSAFPSSIPQIYQSFTMMLRDHWTACQAIPGPQKRKFMEFKTKNNQGASDSKNYWMHAARRTGMVNTRQGIDINDASRQTAARIPPFGTNSDTTASLLLEKEDTEPLVLEEDKELLKDTNLYWFVLLQQVQRVRLSASERVGNRKSLRIGLPGFGCRYCCQAGRLGLSRIFPARRRTLPSKIPDIHDHLRRCPLCPQSVKDELEELEQGRKQQQEQWQLEQGKTVPYSAGNEKEFFTRIWARLGHGNKPEPS